MRSELFLMLCFALVTVVLTGGCAAKFLQPDVTAPHATLVFPSEREVRASGVFLEPWDINGLRRSRYLPYQDLRVPPGELEVRVMATTEMQQGACVLGLTAADGETYRLGVRVEEGLFVIEATRPGRPVARCEAPKTLRPMPLIRRHDIVFR